MIIFYCLRFETPTTWRARLCPKAMGSLFVASYDSQGDGGGIRPRLHTGLLSRPAILVIQPRGGSNRKHRHNSSSIVVMDGCLAIARILFDVFYRSLPSNSCSFSRLLHSDSTPRCNIYEFDSCIVLKTLRFLFHKDEPMNAL
jgi:hypothetical protein